VTAATSGELSTVITCHQPAGYAEKLREAV